MCTININMPLVHQYIRPVVGEANADGKIPRPPLLGLFCCAPSNGPPFFALPPPPPYLPLAPRQAAAKGDHNRVAMYLRKYREGKARRGELPRIAVYNTALRALDQCSKWRL